MERRAIVGVVEIVPHCILQYLNDVQFECQVWNCSKRVFKLNTNFTLLQQSADHAALKKFEVKDHIERPFLKIKMIDLNKKTLSLYKRLDDKIKQNYKIIK